MSKQYVTTFFADRGFHLAESDVDRVRLHSFIHNNGDCLGERPSENFRVDDRRVIGTTQIGCCMRPFHVLVCVHMEGARQEIERVHNIK